VYKATQGKQYGGGRGVCLDTDMIAGWAPYRALQAWCKEEVEFHPRVLERQTLLRNRGQVVLLRKITVENRLSGQAVIKVHEGVDIRFF